MTALSLVEARKAESVTRLKSAFIGRTATPLKVPRGAKAGAARLPFVASWRTETPARYWNAPASGGYFGGYETGEAMALMFLKFLRAEEGELAPMTLTQIAESFMVRFDQEGGYATNKRRGDSGDSFDSLRGQYVGFFNTLSTWLAASAKTLGASLDRLAEQDLVQRANWGLGFDDAAYMASLSGHEGERTQGLTP